MKKTLYELTEVTEDTLNEHKTVGGNIPDDKKVYDVKWLTWFEALKLKRSIKLGNYPNDGSFWIIEVKKYKK